MANSVGAAPKTHEPHPASASAPPPKGKEKAQSAPNQPGDSITPPKAKWAHRIDAFMGVREARADPGKKPTLKERAQYLAGNNVPHYNEAEYQKRFGTPLPKHMKPQ